MPEKVLNEHTLEGTAACLFAKIVQKAGFSILSHRWHYTSTLPVNASRGEREPGAI